MENMKCVKCKGEMEKGTFGGLWGAIAPWAKGNMFLKWISSNNISKEVKVYCCKNCGYIESYAK